MSCSCKKNNHNSNEKMISKEVKIEKINSTKKNIWELLDISSDTKVIKYTNPKKEIVRSK